RAEVGGQRVDVDDVEILAGRAHEHPESGAAGRHEIADDQRVGALLLDRLAVGEASPLDALASLLPGIEPDFHAGYVTVGQMIAARDALLERILEHRALDGESHQPILERLDLID